MTEVLPLMLLPAVVGWWLAEWRRQQRSARGALRAAVSATRPNLLPDAGVAPVVAVARSLETVPTTNRLCPWWLVGRRRGLWEIEQLVAPLGLRLDEVIGIRRDRLRRPIGFVGASRFSGVRHHRTVTVELGVARSEVRLRAPLEFSDFAVHGAADGQLRASGDAPTALVAGLETLAPSRHWRGVTLRARGTTLTLSRDQIAASSWLHDLWVAEFIADLAMPAAECDARHAAAAVPPPARAVSGATGRAVAPA